VGYGGRVAGRVGWIATWLTFDVEILAKRREAAEVFEKQAAQEPDCLMRLLSTAHRCDTMLSRIPGVALLEALSQ
jgi:hypothetical protein